MITSHGFQMTLLLKKKRERFFAEEAAKIMGRTWDIGPDSEAPDFLIAEGAHQFGLEVCEIFTGSQGRSGSAMKEAESHNQQAVDALRREFEATTDVALTVKLVGDVCEENLALVLPALHAADLASKPIAYQSKIELDTGLRARLNVYVTKALRPEWYVMKDRVGFVDRNPMPRIVDALKKKSKKIPQYKLTAGPNIRLLIVADRFSSSGKLIPENTYPLDLMGFQKVYFFSYPESVIAFDETSAGMNVAT
jgi:hypothetical protein